MHEWACIKKSINNASQSGHYKNILRQASNLLFTQCDASLLTHESKYRKNIEPGKSDKYYCSYLLAAVHQSAEQSQGFNTSRTGGQDRRSTAGWATGHPWLSSHS